jgi:hypothetical protein
MNGIRVNTLTKICGMLNHCVINLARMLNRDAVPSCLDEIIHFYFTSNLKN